MMIGTVGAALLLAPEKLAIQLNSVTIYTRHG
jgi:hypothetical protein